MILPCGLLRVSFFFNVKTRDQCFIPVEIWYGKYVYDAYCRIPTLTHRNASGQNLSFSYFYKWNMYSTQECENENILCFKLLIFMIKSPD